MKTNYGGGGYYYGFDYNTTTAASACSPLMEFYGRGGASITAVAQATFTVTVTAANSFVAGNSVSISGITAGGSGNCTAIPAADIDGTHLIVTASATNFTFTAGDSVTINGTNKCTIAASAAATLQPYTITGITQTAGTTVTVTAAGNAFVAGQTVVISGIAAGTGGCTTAALAGINGERTVQTSGSSFTFTSPVTAAIASGACTLTGATADGPTQDYLFFGASVPGEAFTFTLPRPTGLNAFSPISTNSTADATGGTSDMTVDNDSTSGQAASIYFGTLVTSNACGTGTYCAVKLTQFGLN